jgi:peptidoglycan/LPS O-acetylase OafA/YrhL
MKYRPDIDGLRAVAVLSVIFYHLNPTLVPAGFVGVDIFFVISGYLISLQIFKDIDLQRFSLLEFYRRRVKRIAPAMLVVLGVTLIFAQFMLRPEDAEAVGRSSFWSLLSVANAHFWLADDGSYFAGPSDQLPLLHFWSLAVEEQFYMLWPLVLLLFRNHIHSAFFALMAIGIAALSFMFGQYYFSTDPSFVYYMLPARAGELLIGALAAWWAHSKGHMSVSGRTNQALATGGLALILGSLIFVSHDDPFPGFAAIAPTFGTAVLILSGGAGPTWVRKILTLPTVVWVGIVSYSAYLWHWPILAFLRYGGVNISLPIGVIVIASTFGAAWLSYTYIETPFRRTRRSALAVFGRMYILPAAVLGFIAISSLKTDGRVFHRYFPDYMARLEQVRVSLQPAYELDYVCQRQRISIEDLNNPDCVLGSPDAPNSVILWGDSNAAHYIGMLWAFSETAGFRFQNIQLGSCPPLHSDPSQFAAPRRRDDCLFSNRLIWPQLQEFETVIISASWTGYQETSQEFFDQFELTVDLLEDAGAKIILLGKAPVFPGYDRLCHEKALRFTAMNCDVESAPLDAQVLSANRRLRLIAEERDNVEYFDANKYLCPNGSCSIKDENGMIRYYDSDHLTADASRQLGRSIVDRFGVPSVFSARGK